MDIHWIIHLNCLSSKHTHAHCWWTINDTFMPATRKKSFPVDVCVCVCASLWSTEEERNGKKRRAGEKRKSRSRTKRWESALKQTPQSFSTNCDQMSFSQRRTSRKKNLISIVFETNIIKQTSGVTLKFTVKTNKFTQTGTTTAILPLTFNIGLSMCAH